MKKLFFFIVLLLFNNSFLFSQVAINTDGTAADNSAMLDVKSISKGLLPPRMTREELTAIAKPADGLLVYCIDCGSNGSGTLSIFITGAWFTLSANCMNPLTPVAVTHVASATQIVWNWNAVADATGYKWNTINDYSTAEEIGTANTKIETGLSCSSPYKRYLWAWNGCGYSSPLTLWQTTATCETEPNTVTDIDGNNYHTVTIGTQVWMLENLKTTKYNDGTSIPNVTDKAAWTNLTTPGYCWYNNAIDNKIIYGALYNWHTVNTGKLAPLGWHVPTDAEWTTLTDFLTNNGYGYGGNGSDIAKSLAATSGWGTFSTLGTIGNEQSGNNSTGFSALPGGYCDFSTGNFSGLLNSGYWWSSTAYAENSSRIRNLNYNHTTVAPDGYNMRYGFSVRCVKDYTIANAVTPVLNTISVSNIKGFTAISGGNISSDGGASVTARGVCWSTMQNPTIADSKTADGGSTGTFISNLTGLTKNTSYYVRAYATNIAGTSYGNEVSFTTTNEAPNEDVTDIDGNVYHTVTIGNQIWMVENLKTTKYNDGSSIPKVSEDVDWAALSTGAYCWYNNIVSNTNTYGALYNWNSVNTGKLAPTGWHIPTDAEWTTLTTFLGGESSAGNKLKEIGTTHWITSTNATNSSGFAALPAGRRSSTGLYSDIGGIGCWWSSTQYNTSSAWSRLMSHYYTDVYRYNNYDKESGFSVRCIKD